eukprot:gene564-8_t
MDDDIKPSACMLDDDISEDEDELKHDPIEDEDEAPIDAEAGPSEVLPPVEETIAETPMAEILPETVPDTEVAGEVAMAETVPETVVETTMDVEQATQEISATLPETVAQPSGDVDEQMVAEPTTSTTNEGDQKMETSGDASKEIDMEVEAEKVEEEPKHYTEYKQHGKLDVDKILLHKVRRICKQSNSINGRKLKLKNDGLIALARLTGAFFGFLGSAAAVAAHKHKQQTRKAVITRESIHTAVADCGFEELVDKIKRRERQGR